jgi:feruloyl esterase
MDEKIHPTRRRAWPGLAAAAATTMLLAACGGGGEGMARLAEARPASLRSCDDLAARISFANTRITAAESVAAGALTVAGQPVAAHCRVTGRMHERVGSVDGQSYAIGFEMRLPRDWNGRFFYQANGGLDGSVGTAVGALGGGPLSHALHMGFAVLSSDAGHVASQGPFFGLDPQARLDYGYQAVGRLTPMARSALQTAYGKEPDRSYLGGCSNGGRHAMVAASRYADQYDGIIAGNPGTRLPLAAIANIAGAQAYAGLATSADDLGTGFTQAERRLVSQAVLARCDALDGARDGMVQAGAACQAAFDLERDVPSCTGARDGSCLSSAQKTAIGGLFKGAAGAAGQRIYSSFPYDAGLDTAGWASWKFSNPISRDAGAVAFVWQTPPESAAGFNDRLFALNGNVDGMLAKVQATNGLYTESGLSLMTPPDYGRLPLLRARGAKLMVYHGTADPIFSSDDSVQWYETLRSHHGDAADFARLYLVPGMNHCSGGPATEQFDMLTALVAWVEKGQAPERIVASARGAGNAGGANADLPASWSPTRTRPLCPHPLTARYDGSGDMESAASFSCR